MELQKKLVIRTMAKDIARLREAEVGIEREKIMKMKVEEVKVSLKVAEKERKKIEEEKKKAEMEKKRIEEARKKEEELRKKEIILAKKKEEEEARKRVEEEKKKAEMEKKRIEEEIRMTKIRKLLEKVRLPVAKLKERVELKKVERPEIEEKPKLEEKFFKKIPLEKVPEVEKIPERELIERLKRAEERRERERKEREEFLKKVAEEKIEIKPLIPKEEVLTRFPLISKIPPKKAPLGEKVFVRVIVIGFLVAIWAAIFTFWYWFLAARQPLIVAPPSPPPPIEKREVIIPPSLIPVLKTKTLEYTTPEELKLGLSQILVNEGYPEEKFQQILIKNTKSGKFLNLWEIFEVGGINIPQALYQKLGSDFTLFLYPTKKYNRLGFLVKIKERENLTNLMRSWEPTMEKDFENLFSLLGKGKPALIPYFRGAQYQGVSFRFQTFSREDLGICYSIFGDYFIWTSSWESITKVINLLK